MKSVLIKISVSFIIVSIALWSLSLIYDFALLHNSNIKSSHIQRSKINADVLILGPCQALWNAQPSVIKKKTGFEIYNLGLTNADFADNYLHLYLYLKHNKAPRYLFLHVSMESMDLSYNIFTSFHFAPFIGDAVVDSVVKEWDNSYFKWTGIPFMKYAYYNNNVNFDVIQGLKHFYTNKTTPYFADGYESAFSLNKEVSPEQYVQIYPSDCIFTWNYLLEKYLRKTIVLAQQNGIHVYLYESPILKEALTNVRNRPEIITKIKSVADAYGIKFVQFENMKISDSVNYFITSVGLTKKGAVIFSDSLGKYIYNENLRK
jgi:hypothetical protein